MNWMKICIPPGFSEIDRLAQHAVFGLWGGQTGGVPYSIHWRGKKRPVTTKKGRKVFKH